jgi:hypothetical protein
MTKYLFLILFFGYSNTAFCQEKVLVIKDSITDKNVVIFENSNVEVKINSDINYKYLKGKLKVLNDSMLAINQDTFFLESLIDLKINTLKIPIRVAAALLGSGLIASSVFLVKKGTILYSGTLQMAFFNILDVFQNGYHPNDPVFTCLCCSLISGGVVVLAIAVNLVALAPALAGIPLLNFKHHKYFSTLKNKNSKIRLSRFIISDFNIGKKSK